MYFSSEFDPKFISQAELHNKCGELYNFEEYRNQKSQENGREVNLRISGFDSEIVQGL